MMHSAYRLFLYLFPYLIRGFDTIQGNLLYIYMYYSNPGRKNEQGYDRYVVYLLYVVLLTQLWKVEKRTCCGCTFNV